jgi:hypothetical protein
MLSGALLVMLSGANEVSVVEAAQSKNSRCVMLSGANEVSAVEAPQSKDRV